MNHLVTSEQMKLAERNAVKRGISLLDLAENAAHACFKQIKKSVGDLSEKTATILCGHGMNGGDGILTAALLKHAGVETLCVFVNDSPYSGLAREIYEKYADTLVTTPYFNNQEGIEQALRNSQIIVDCVFGTGFKGELSSEAAKLFAFVNNECTCIKFSVDIPSGINSDDGVRAEHSFIPDITLVLGAYKKGMLSHRACDYCGECLIMDIGLSAQDYTEYEATFSDSSVMSSLPERPESSHKGKFGRLLNIAGSERYIGAALLSTKAAINSGVGLVILASTRPVILAISPHVPEAIFAQTESGVKALTQDLKSATAVSVGCGLGVNPDSRKTAEFVIRNAECPVILDADGINAISDNINVLKENKSIVITPHPAEFSRLTGLTVEEVQSNRIDAARIFAKESGAVVVLKGVNTVIASPEGIVCVNTTGNAGLARAGTGDVLTGVIGSLAAQGVEPFTAAVLGAYLHGLAADEVAKTKPLAGITASDVAQTIGLLQ